MQLHYAEAFQVGAAPDQLVTPELRSTIGATLLLPLRVLSGVSLMVEAPAKSLLP